MAETDSETIEVSVVIPAYNAAKTLGPCIESVLAQQTCEPFEIIVVDDGSSDDTAEIAARYPKVRVFTQQNSGAGAARNLAAREARGWILCLIDADCVAVPGWMESLVRAIRDGADGVKGTLLSSQPEPVARFTQIEYEDKYDRMAPKEHIDFIDTGSAAYRRDVFLSAGGFAEGIPAVEDQEMSFRLAKSGRDLRFVADARVYHRHPATLKAYVRRKFAIGRFKVLVHLRHPERVVTDSHTPPSQKVQLALFYGLVASLALAPFSRLARRLPAPLLWAFVASAVPFIRKAARKDPQVAALSPFFLFVRAASLGAGVAYGTLRLIASKLGDSRPVDE